MTFVQLIMLSIYCIGMVLGQIMLKLSSIKGMQASGLKSLILELATSPAFITAITLYFAMSLFWVWLLAQVPLSKAYPFAAISFVLTALSGMIFFGERLSSLNAIGLILIVAGVTLATQ